MRALFLFLSVLAITPASADSTPAPPLPIRTVETATSEPRADEAATLARLSAEVGSARAALAPAADSGAAATSACRPPPATVRVRPGVNEILPISLGQLNRLRTPFAQPTIKTSNDEHLTYERELGGLMFISATSPQPVGVYIYEEGAPDPAMSLTLLPCGGAEQLPPVDITLTFEGAPDDVAIARAPVAAQAIAWEQRSPYVDTIKALFRHLALGEVPAGYGLQALRREHPLMPACDLQGLDIMPAQLLEGGAVLVLVARVHNRGGAAIAIDESACAAPGVLAVAAWPEVLLAPGQATELFIAVRRPEAEPGVTRRPSVLAGGAP